MITAKFKQNLAGLFTSFEITGHAGFADIGEDIVCAAVSVLAIETVNSLDKMAGHQMIVEEADREGGYLYAEVRPELTPEQKSITQILLKHLYLSLEDVATTYPDYVRIKKLTRK